MTEDVVAQRSRALAGALVEHGFARVRVRDGELEIEVRRRLPPAPAQTVSAQAAAAPPPRRADILTSDVVGIFRCLRPAVAEGAELDADRELAYVETLGIRNSVRSMGAGRVRDVLAADGQPVEYGQPLFAIER
jgi:acetyl-CoA carboxylase biotin carboxyl carrier protein